MKLPGSELPRRQRFLALVVAGAVVFAALTAAAFWWLSPEDRVYRPGEPIEGLSAVLERSVPADAPRVTFTDATAAAGVEFRHFPGRRTTQLPEDMGSGAAWHDYDGDGWLDLYVVNQAGPLELSPDEIEASPAHAALFRNRGDGTFEDVSEVAGVDFRGTGMAAAWADYDGDGAPDLLVTAYDRLVLYRNAGDGTFDDVTDRAGLAGFRGFWAGASWADYDRDGDLDVYVTGYVRYRELEDQGPVPQYDIEQPASLNPSAFPPQTNLLLRNDGDGAFTDVAAEAGVADPEGRSLSAAWADLDSDGWPDLYVANDVSDNRLFRNRGGGTFEDLSHPALVADYRGAMGIAVGDWDRDADIDLFVTHWVAQENALYTNLRSQMDRPDEGGLRFMDVADRFGLGQSALDFVGWGTSFFDYDNDGRLDLLVVNGSTLMRSDDPARLVPMRDQLLWNAGERRGFYDVAPLAGSYFEREHVGRGAAFGDYDNDGDVDVFIVNHGDRGVLLRNDAPADRGWFQAELVGRRPDRSAIGARLRLVAGGATQTRIVGAQPSYLSQNSPVQHFGLGDASVVDTLEVVWPSGTVQRFTDLRARRRVRIAEGADSVSAQTAASPGATDRDRVRQFWEHFREATRHRVAGRSVDAVAAYREARALDPDHEDTLYYLGSVLMDLGRFDEARDPLERLVETNPASARGHARLGTLHLCSTGSVAERLAAAEAAFRRNADLNREATGPYIRLAEVALVRQDLPAATRALEIVLGSDPNSAPAQFLKGFVAWTDSRETDAVATFREALATAVAGTDDGLVSGEGDTGGGVAMTAREGEEYCPVPLVRAGDLTTDELDTERVAAAMDVRYGAIADRIRRLRR